MVVVLKAGGPLNQFILMNLATLKDKGATNGTKGTRWKKKHQLIRLMPTEHHTTGATGS